MNNIVNHDKAETQATERPRRYEVGISGWTMPKKFVGTRMENEIRGLTFYDDNNQVVFFAPTHHVQYVLVSELLTVAAQVDR